MDENMKVTPEATPAVAHEDNAAASDAAVQAALSAPCDMYLRRHKGKYSLSIPGLGLMVSDASLEAAYAKMEGLRERRIREFASEGMLHLISGAGALPGAPAAPAGTAAKLKPFFIKSLVVALLFLGAMNILSHTFGDVGYTLEKKLKSVSYWTPEEVEKQREQTEKIAQHLGPIVRELMTMFRQPGEVPGAANATAPVANATAAEK
jgi:hypothetical protein